MLTFHDWLYTWLNIFLLITRISPILLVGCSKVLIHLSKQYTLFSVYYFYLSRLILKGLDSGHRLLSSSSSLQTRVISFTTSHPVRSQQTLFYFQSLCLYKVKNAAGIWTCDLCNVTATREITLNSHLQGRKHRAKFVTSMKQSLFELETLSKVSSYFSW